MSTTQNPVQPLTLSLQGGTLNEILGLLSDALATLSTVVPGAGIALVVEQIIIAAVNRIQSQTGKPIDLTQIPVETPLP